MQVYDLGKGAGDRCSDRAYYIFEFLERDSASLCYETASCIRYTPFTLRHTEA
jgi:hypothetical protein